MEILEGSNFERSPGEAQSQILLETQDETYQATFIVKYSKGHIDFFPKIIKQDIVFPFASDLLSVNALSTFNETITLTIPQRQLKGSNIVDLITFNRIMNKGLKENFFQFKIDPNQMGFPEEFMMSQKNHTDLELCLRDLDVQNNNEKLYQKIMQS